MLEQSVRHNPEEPSFHFHYASSLGKAGWYEDSERHFLLALEKSQSDSASVASYHANLGISLYLQLNLLKHDSICVSKVTEEWLDGT